MAAKTLISSQHYRMGLVQVFSLKNIFINTIIGPASSYCFTFLASHSCTFVMLFGMVQSGTQTLKTFIRNCKFIYYNLQFMKKLIFSFLFVSPLLVTAQKPMEIMTFNIRLNTSSDSLNAWPYRKDKVASQILFYQVSLLGVQEALHDQMVDLQQRLPGYKYSGVGRDDGKTKGEYSAIFFDTARLQKLDGATFWLSQTPEMPGSKSWDAAITRIVSWCKFYDTETHKIFFAFNTHFDHIGQVARAESAKLLLKRVNDIAGNTPVIVMGDFNAGPEDEPIKIITNTQYPGYLLDTKNYSETPHYGPSGTFNGFKNSEINDAPIDHIFMKKGIKVLKHATISETWQGRFASDHFAVLARVVVE